MRRFLRFVNQIRPAEGAGDLIEVVLRRLLAILKELDQPERLPVGDIGAVRALGVHRKTPDGYGVTASASPPAMDTMRSSRYDD